MNTDRCGLIDLWFEIDNVEREVIRQWRKWYGLEQEMRIMRGHRWDIAMLLYDPPEYLI